MCLEPAGPNRLDIAAIERAASLLPKNFCPQANFFKNLKFVLVWNQSLSFK